MQRLKITATMAGSLAGAAPQLDSLLERRVSIRRERNGQGVVIDTSRPCPPEGFVPIPLMRRAVSEKIASGTRDRLIAYCSSPIMAEVAADSVVYVNRRLDTGKSSLLAESERLNVSTTSGTFKSWRLPLRTRLVSRIVWFATGDREGIVDLLRDVRWIGKKVSNGNGEVMGWQIEPFGEDYSWFARCPASGRTLLMRPLPACMDLPTDLSGFRQSFGSCSPPYWHPDRFGEIVEPC